MRGTMLWFNEDKGHGFISTEDGERLRVEESGFMNGGSPEGPCAGLAVDFQVIGEDDERRAVEVTMVEQIAPRRARRRHGQR